MRDGHVHSHYCPHGTKDTFKMYIEKAINTGIKEISFTEHFPYPEGFQDPSPENDSCITIEQLEKYINELQKVKEDYKDRIKINLGIEIDYLEGFEEESKQLLNKYGKYLEDGILSVHIIKHKGEYYSIDYDEQKFQELIELLGGIDKVYDIYYDTLIKAVKSDLGEYKPKRIGHPNLVRKFNQLFPYDYSNHKQLEELVRLMKERNYEVDYNISGLYKNNCKEEYVSGYLYELIKSYDIPMVLGSDSHSIDTLGIYNKID